MKPTLLVLAAGMGSRYGGLKQIDPVGPAGETVLDYSVYDAARAGFGRVVFVIRREFEALFREKVGDKQRRLLDVGYAFQELTEIPSGVQVDLSHREKPLGTAHAVWCARNEVHTPFAMINADDFYGRESFVTVEKFLRSVETGKGAPFATAMVAFRLANTLSDHGTVSRGVCLVDSQKGLTDIHECTAIRRSEGGVISALAPDGESLQLTGDEPVSMNFWGFTPDIFPELEAGLRSFLQERGTEPKSEAYIPSAVADWVKTGKTRVELLRSEASWFGVTYREDKPQVEAAIRALIERGEYPGSLVPH